MRRPQPLLKQRMPSGRGAMEQPNITSDGAGVLTPRFWVMVVLAGVAAGLLGALMMAILFNVQYAAFGYHEGTLQHGAEQAPAARRVGLAADRGRVRRRRVVPAAAVHQGRAVGDRRGAVERRRAAVVAPLPGHVGDLRGRHRDGRLDRPGSRAQAARRRVRQRPGRLGRPVGAAAAAAGGLRRRRRARRRLQRPAGRGPVHRRDPHRQHHPAGHAAGHRVLGDRDRHRLDIPARSRHLPRHPRLPLHLVGDDLGAAGRAGHRAGLGRLHPAHRLGLPSSRQGHRGAVRAGDRLRHPRDHRHLVPAAVRQRPGHGPRRVPRYQRLRPAAHLVRAQAAGHGPVPGQRRVRRACSPRRWPPARSSAARSASPGTWPGPAPRPAPSPWSARPP